MQHDEDWWTIPYPTRFEPESLKPQDTLSIKGNLLVDEKGQVVTLKGFNIADIDKLVVQGKWSKALFDEITAWGANSIRIPVHPISWRKRGKEWYFKHLDEAVSWANENGLYLLIDWHSIGNLKTGMYQHPMYRTDIVETSNFWGDIAFRYKDIPTIAVYEIFNEPTHDYIGNGAGSLGSITWKEWRDILESLIDIVQVYNKNAVALVAGFNWAYDLSDVIENPVRRDNIAYAIHPYPQKEGIDSKSAAEFKKAWQEHWGHVADKYVVMATELGWVKEGGQGAHIPVIHNDGVYGPAIIEFMSEKNMSWTAWVFDPEWSPVLISDWDFTPSEQGAFFKQVLQNKH